jgi:hypothetical protein
MTDEAKWCGCVRRFGWMDGDRVGRTAWTPDQGTIECVERWRDMAIFAKMTCLDCYGTGRPCADTIDSLATEWGRCRGNHRSSYPSWIESHIAGTATGSTPSAWGPWVGAPAALVTRTERFIERERAKRATHFGEAAKFAAVANGSTYTREATHHDAAAIGEAVRAGLERASLRLRTGVVDPTASKPGDVLKAAPAPSVENVYDATHGAVALGHVRRQLGVGANEPFARVAQAIERLKRERDEANEHFVTATTEVPALVADSALADARRDDALIAPYERLRDAAAAWDSAHTAWTVATFKSTHGAAEAQREASRLLAERMAPGEGLVTDDMVDE